MEKRVLGGIFILLSAIMGLAIGGILIAGGSMIGGLDPTGFVEDILIICGVIFMVFGLIALLGAINAIMGKSWGLAILGAIFALFTIGPYLLGSIFGLIGLILIAMSKEEFGPQMPPYGAPPPGYPMAQPPYGQPPMQQPPMEQPPAQPPMQPPQEPPQQ